jgi:hypothetical protein
MYRIKLNIILLQSIFATGLNELRSGITDTNTLREVARYLYPKDAKALSSSSRNLNVWRRKLVLKQAKNSGHLDRDSSWKLVSSLIAEVENHFPDVSIYPMTLTFNQDDVPLLKKLDVLSFIRRVKTVVFEGATQMVIEANQSATTEVRDGASTWSMELYDPNAAVWGWNQPHSLKKVLDSHTVTAVKRLELGNEDAQLVIELARSWKSRELDGYENISSASPPSRRHFC